MKLNFSKKILILSIVSFVVILGSDIFFTNLLFRKIADINNKVRQIEISSQERLKEFNLKDVVASSKLEREKISGYFIGRSDADTIGFTKYLEDLAIQAGVNENKTLGYETMPGLESSVTVYTIRYKFSVSGKWSNVYKFLQSIESLPKAIYINSASLSLDKNISLDKVSSIDRIWSADVDFSIAKLKK